MISQDRQRKRKANKQGMGKPPSVEESITVKDLSTWNGPHPREQFCNQDDRQNARDNYKSVSPHWLRGRFSCGGEFLSFFFFFCQCRAKFNPKGPS